MSVQIKKFVVSENLKNLPTIHSRTVEPIQGALKDLNETDYSKLLNSILTRGFFVPIFVWYDQEQDVYFALDGHQRLNVINREWPNGQLLPYVSIQAADYYDAKERLLLIDSKYGKITKDGFDEFVADMDDITGFVESLTTYGEWLDVEEFEEEKEEKEKELKGIFAVEVTCVSEKDQERVYNEMISKGYQCKILNL